MSNDRDATPGPDALVTAATAARENAHAPYSRFAVGAAVLTDDGRVFTGCNVENVSYGLTVCAERVAVFSAVAAGAKRIAAIAVVTGSRGSACGACRQVLAEFADPDMPLHIASPDGERRDRLLGDLLPESFTPDDLARGQD